MSRILLVPAILALLVLPLTAQQGSGPGPTCDNPPCATGTGPHGPGGGPGPGSGPGNGPGNGPGGGPNGDPGTCPNYDPATCPGPGNGPGSGPGPAVTPGTRGSRLGHGAGGGGRQGCTGALTATLDGLPIGVLDATETAALLRNREEEKLARDVYLALGRKWDQRIFFRIASSEVHHKVLVGLLLDRYDLVDPITDDTEGVFQDPELAALYTELVARGERSFTAALEVGVTIEQMDLADLQATFAYTDDADLKVVFERLLFATQHHLAAFQRQLGG